ncbi:relaxase/mobilization nuclease domain-containing protein [Leucobacter ruminantium]|uniref:Relaxase/mobilization nuclease domain-containing protein n=1 Tax=Leucobacter ruminantium TaxID=1289170 RepID=A0A939LTQ4_9MICO|nr:relaxase/mobilization nuclease domain-containing protein [Leucobacter ruminantium]MBO1804589.1 relaxase/mobilization nuclease domain-containing protein [Leucobacter ruminantium]
MPVIVVSSTEVAARLARYTVKPKPGQTAADRVLHVAGNYCRPETVAVDFAVTRRRFGTQGAVRTSPSRYALPEAGEVATHVRVTRPNGRRVWREARDGEMATHVCHPGALVRQAEARHLIISFGPDEVNPDDPDQVAYAFAFVNDMMRTDYPGEQFMATGQADGKGGAFHVHVVRNATLYADQEVDGKLYKAGSKLAGGLTDVDAMRDRADKFLAEHGAQYGLGPQRLPSTAERKREKRSSRDRRMARNGEKSNHDIIRDAFEAAMADPRAVDLAGFTEAMAERDVLVFERITRAGTPREKRALSYRLPGMPQNVRGTTLGDHYAHESAMEQLACNRAGKPRERRPERVQAGLPRPVAALTPAELAEIRNDVLAFARDEQLDRMEEEFAAALAVDFDAAGEAYDTGDHETVLRLAAELKSDPAGWRKRLEDQEKRDAAKRARDDAAADARIAERAAQAAAEQAAADAEADARAAERRERLAALAAEQTARSEAEKARVAAALAEREARLTEADATPSIPLVDEEEAGDAQPVDSAPAASTEEPEEDQGLLDQSPEEIDELLDRYAPSEPAAEPEAPVAASPSAPATGPVTPDLTRQRAEQKPKRTVSPRVQAVLDALPEFERTALLALSQGHRIDDRTVPKGLGDKFLRDHGGSMNPLVYEQMMLREKKKRTAAWLHELGRYDARDATRDQISRGVYEMVAEEEAVFLEGHEEDEAQFE